MALIQRYSNTVQGALTYTGNTLGFSWITNPGEIGAYLATTTGLSAAGYPVPSTFNWVENGSTAVLNLPVGSTVLYAELIWGGSTISDAETLPISTLNTPITFKTPLGTNTITYDPITASQSPVLLGQIFYTRSSDVTALVQAAGAGTYEVDGVPATLAPFTPSITTCAGWTLSVAYFDPSLPFSNLNIYVGNVGIAAGDPPVDTMITGFITPPAGSINARILASAMEGDIAPGIGDEVLLGPNTGSLTALFGPNNIVNNFFASQINNDAGVLDTSGSFGTLNQNPNGPAVAGVRYGWDITNVNGSSQFVNSQTQAVVRLTTSLDTYVVSTLGVQIQSTSPTISMVKSGNTKVNAGDPINYTLTIENTGALTTDTFTVTDPAPTGTTINTGSINVVGATGPVVDNSTATGLNIQLGPIAVNQIVTITYTVNTTATTPFPVLNTAEGSYNFTPLGGVTVPGTATSNQVTTNILSADVSVVKTSNPNPVIAGQMVTYTEVVSNAGPDPAQNVILTDAVPATITGVQFSTDGGATFNPWVSPYTIGTIAAGASVTVLIRGTVNPAATGSITNTAVVSSTTSDPDPTNNTSTVTTPVNTLADIVVVKTASPSPVIAGEQLVYTVTVSNAGPSDAQSVTLTDTVPACILTPGYSLDGGITFNPWTGSANLGTIAAGASVTVLIKGTVDPSCTGTITNTATANSPTPDPDPTNNTSTVTTPVNTLADIAVVKTASPDPVVAGQLVTYTLLVPNAGPSDAQNVTLTDAVPVSIQNQQYSLDGGVTFNPWTGSVNLGTIAAGTSKTVLIKGTVSSSATGTITNTATVSSPTPDPDPTNNTSTITTPVNTSADISVVKTANPSPVVAGQLITYTEVVSNVGPSDAQSVMLTDTVPACILTPQYSLDGGVSFNPWTGSVNLGTIAAGGSVTVLIKGTVDPSCTGTITNTATVSSQTPDPDPTNNTSTVTTPVNTSADISVAKTANPSPVVAGQLITYTEVVSSAGPSDAQNVTLTDAVPASIQNQQYSLDGGVTFNTWTGSVNIGIIAAGTSKTVLIKGIVSPSATGSITNTAVVSSPTPDPDPTNNTSTITTQVNTSADISVVKTANPSLVVAGQLVTYTEVVSNAGPSDAQNVSLTDAVPASIQNPQYSLDGGVTFNPWTGSVNLGTIAAGTSKTVLIKGIVSPSATGSITNTAVVSSTTSDPDPTNNTSTITTQINTSADISVVKTANPSPVVAGQLITYTEVVTNAGPSDAQSVTLTDTVPACILTPEYSLDGGVSFNTWTGSVNLGTIVAGGSVTVLIKGTVDPSCTGTITNTATVSSQTPDPDPTNNTSTVTTPVNTSADISVVKTANPSPVVAGQLITYTEVVSNAGPSDAQNVTLTDTVPATIQNPQYSLDGGITFNPWTGSVNLGTIPVGASVTVLIKGTVSPSATGTITNTAVVSSSTSDPDPTNNTSTITTQVNVSADIAVAKTANPNPVVAGQLITYTEVVSNGGPSDAQNVSLTDAIPASIQNPQYSLDGGVTFNPWTGSVNLGTIAAGTSKTVLIKGIVRPSATGSITNTAVVSSPTPDPDPTNNTSTITTQVNTSADIAVAKTANPSPVVAGQLITYTEVVTNAGLSDAQSVTLTDTVPACILNPEYSLDGGVTFNTWTGSVNLGTIVAGGSVTVLIKGTVDPSCTGTITNTATVKSTTPDPNPTNNTSTTTTPINTSADISIVKTNISKPVVAGQQVEYSLVVTNAGPSDALSVVVSDTIPANIQNPQYSLDGGTTWLVWTGSVNLGTITAGGASITILIRGTVISSATGTLKNTATVNSPTPDPSPSNNTSTTTDMITTSADLVITKVGSPNPVTAGSQITYTIIVTDNGPSDAQSVSLTDQVIANIQNPQYSLDGGTTWLTWNGSLNIGTVAVGTQKIVLIRGTVSSVTTGNLSNTATVTSPTPDPNPNNNTVTTSTLVNNVTMVKTSTVTGAEIGDTIPYILTITNKGEVTAESVVVRDVLVPQLSYADNLKLNGNPIGGNITQGVGIGNLLPGQSMVLTFDATVVAIPIGKIIDNQATASYQYRANPTAPPISGAIKSNIYQVRIYTPSIQVTKQADTPSVVVGEPFTYTINVTNTGDIAVDHVMLTDALPVSFEVQSITVDNVAINGNIGTGIDIGTLAIGQTKVVILTIIINDTVNISTFKNVVNANGEVTVDPAFPPRPVTATGTNQTGIAIYNPKLTLVKSADKSYVVVGDIVTYTIKATNTGNVNLNNIQLDSVIISDLLSSELAFVTGSITLDGVPLPNASILAGVNIGSILVDQTKTLTFKATVLSDAVTPIENTAFGEFRYTLPGRPTETNTTQSNHYDLNVRKASLTIVKTADKQEARLGDVITYTVLVTNTGDLTAYNVLITDQLPAQVELVPGSFMIDTQVVNGVDLATGVTIPSIAPGVTITITYQVKVVGSNCSGELINQAQVKFEYRLPNGTGGTLTVTGDTSSTTVDLTLTTFKQMSIESYLMIPVVKPDIETINVVTGTIDSVSYHVITPPQGISAEGQTLTGYKLIINGNLNVVIEYTALEETQGVHSAYYTIPFSNFIVLPPTYVIGSRLEVTGLVEDIYYKAIDIRTFFTNTTALMNVKILSY